MPAGVLPSLACENPFLLDHLHLVEEGHDIDEGYKGQR
jgi:hypothetical protein